MSNNSQVLITVKLKNGSEVTGDMLFASPEYVLVLVAGTDGARPTEVAIPRKGRDGYREIVWH